MTTAEYRDFQIEAEPACTKCGNSKSWLDCWHCGGAGEFELYEEDPLWYDVGDVEECSNCDARGGYYVCANCHPESFDD